MSKTEQFSMREPPDSLQKLRGKYIVKVPLDLSGLDYWNGEEWIPLGIYPRLLRYRTTRWIYKLLQYRIRVLKKSTIRFHPPGDWSKYEPQEIDEGDVTL